MASTLSELTGGYLPIALVASRLPAPRVNLSNTVPNNNVVSLSEYKSQDTIRVLRALLRRAIANDLTGLAITYRDRTAREKSAFTGHYRGNHAAAVNAAMRQSWQLTQLQDQLCGPP